MTIVIIDSGEYHQWILKLLVKILTLAEHLDSLKVSPGKSIINFKSKNGYFTLEKTGRHDFNQVTRNSGTNWHCVPPDTQR